jgi:hypothetical protein
MSVFVLFETIALRFTHRAEGARYLTSGPWSDMDVAIERHMDVLERVLK